MSPEERDLCPVPEDGGEIPHGRRERERWGRQEAWRQAFVDEDEDVEEM